MGKLTVKERIKHFFIKLAKERASTVEIARGAGIGTFISVFPTFGAGMFLVVFLNKVMKFNLMAALALSVISNPFTSPFFMVLSYKIGAFITGSKIEFNLDNWDKNLSDTAFVMLIGSLLVSAIMGLLAYYFSMFVVTRIRKSNPDK
jgi:uncharacterized protein (DUF2062 family)